MSSEFSEFAQTIIQQKYAHGNETWPDIAKRVATSVLGAVNAPKDMVKEVEKIIRERKFLPGGRYLYSAGRLYHQVNNCMLFRAEDSRQGWSELMYKATQSLMSGAGIGVVYNDIRAQGRPLKKTGGQAAGPIALMNMVNDIAHFIMMGGSRRSAIWAGLSWKHPDIHKFIRIKDWVPEVIELKKKNFSHPAPMDMTNVSVLLDDEFFEAVHNVNHPKNDLALTVYNSAVRRMLKTAEPGFSVDTGENSGEELRNACCEITSYDDSDICNLGSINMSRIKDTNEMKHVVELATAFLLAGTVYSLVPFPGIDQVRSKNRRLGLGLMGLHEWLLLKGYSYGPCGELAEYLRIYQYGSRAAADSYARIWDLNPPKKVRAIAPTGSIGIIAETTTGIEPVFCVAYKRRYLKGATWHYQYVIEPVAKRLIEKEGLSPDSIEDANSLAEDVERRLGFQAWVQQYVDHGISSTINLPAWGTSLNDDNTISNFTGTFLRYLPRLRGLTCYPNGGRGGQPLVPVNYKEAKDRTGIELVEMPTDICEVTGKGGPCGD